MAEQTNILIIYTGGTIGMVEDATTGQLKPFDFAHLEAQIPELKQFDYTLSSIAFEKPIDSSDMTPEIWARLAGMIEKNYAQTDGFVILHGSDTMAYTASALSFMLEGLNKPVILTGSQLPIGVIRTDGKENIITAIQIAGSKQEGKPLVPEVAVYFEYKLYRGNRTTKTSAENFDAFQSLNYPHLAEAGVHINFNKKRIADYKEGDLKVNTEMNNNIALLRLFPGIIEPVVNAVLNIHGIRAVVLETFGSGNASSAGWFVEAIEKAVQKGIIILNITQCIAGRVEQGKYETSTGLKKAGVIGGKDMTSEAALTKLMCLLGQNLPTEKVKELLQVSLRGELTD